MFQTVLSVFVAAVVAPGPLVPAADSPLRVDGDAMVFSTYDLRRDAYRLVIRRGRNVTRLPEAASPEPFDADVDGDVVVVARDGKVRGRAGRLPSLSRGALATVVGEEVQIGGRVVARAPGITDIALDGQRLAVASQRGVEVVDLRTERTRRVARATGAIGLSFAGPHLGWYARGAYRADLRTGRVQTAGGPGDVSGFALLDGGRTARIEPEGEDGRLRISTPRWRRAAD